MFSVQKELIYDEQDKIQNLQAQEIAKLKNLLNFREQVRSLLFDDLMTEIIFEFL